jgi:poly [ADP-ribose] polymerase
LETSGGLIKINTNGSITTPLGLVSTQSIITAEAILKDIEKEVKAKKDISSSLESYLRVIPQKIPARRGWQDTFFKDDDSFQKQYDFLKQLKASVDWNASAEAADEKVEEDNIEEKYKTLFKSNVGVLDNPREFRKIEKFFKSSVNPMHGNASRLQLKRVFTLTSEVDDEIFAQKAKELGNVQELWHGTRAFNVLSILRKGLFVPPVSGSGILVTGRMFGNGLYLSSQSSKSLRYSSGAWSGARENNCFMFLTETVMGNTYKPRSSFSNAIAEGNDTHGRPYNSTHIKGGTCGVINDEMIVRDPAQVKLKYLCEFDL